MRLATRKSANGFTLVEMLVVLAIIGVLAAILVPTIGVAVRTVRQGAIRTEMKQMEVAIENYKTKFNSYPIDFDPRGRQFVAPHVKKISRRAILRKPGRNPDLYADLMTNRFCPNPHYVEGLAPGDAGYRGPEYRNFTTMLPHEALVFMLSELSTNAEYPLGYKPSGRGVFALVDYTWDANLGKFLLTGNKQTFFDFNDNRLVDLDGDGWLEYMPSGGLDAPYVYFDSRIYRNVPAYGIDFETGGTVAEIGGAGVVGAGFAVPYWTNATTPVEANGYQLLCCGMDNNFGVSPVTSLRGFPSGENFTLEDRDNLANFTDLRLDENLAE